MTPSPTPVIPVEGDIQVFANPECTEYATGDVDTVYVRINTPWTGLDSGWEVDAGDDDGSKFIANSPTTEIPEDPYDFYLWVDYASQTNGPYTAGQVVEAKNGGGSRDITDFTKVFTKPE